MAALPRTPAGRAREEREEHLGGPLPSPHEAPEGGSRALSKPGSHDPHHRGTAVLKQTTNLSDMIDTDTEGSSGQLRCGFARQSLPPSRGRAGAAEAAEGHRGVPRAPRGAPGTGGADETRELASGRSDRESRRRIGETSGDGARWRLERTKRTLMIH